MWSYFWMALYSLHLSTSPSHATNGWPSARPFSKEQQWQFWLGYNRSMASVSRQYRKRRSVFPPFFLNNIALFYVSKVFVFFSYKYFSVVAAAAMCVASYIFSRPKGITKAPPPLDCVSKKGRRQRRHPFETNPLDNPRHNLCFSVKQCEYLFWDMGVFGSRDQKSAETPFGKWLRG